MYFTQIVLCDVSVAEDGEFERFQGFGNGHPFKCRWSDATRSPKKQTVRLWPYCGNIPENFDTMKRRAAIGKQILPQSINLTITCYLCVEDVTRLSRKRL